MATGLPSKRNRSTKNSISLTYQGKEDAVDVLSKKGPTFIPVIDVNGGGLNELYFGDNFDVLLYLLDNGFKEKIKLVYIDPPFSTNSLFVNREQKHAFSDVLSGAEYVEFLRKRLILLRSLLSKDGSIYLHLDGNMAFTMKVIMDEIYGEENCRALITRKKCSTKNCTRKTYGNVSDYILFYSKGPKYTWNRPYDSWDITRMKKEYPYIDEKTNRRYKKVPVHAPGIRNGETGKKWHGMYPPPGKHWQYTPEKLDALDAAGDIYWSPTGNPRRKVYFEPDKGIPVQDIWLNYRDSINQSNRTTGYPTEKNPDMMKMIVCASSDPGDVVLDCFAGSGTTLGAAFENGRKWIGADVSLESIRAITKRFTEGLDAYGDYVRKKSSISQNILSICAKCSFSIYSDTNNAKILESDRILKEMVNSSILESPARTVPDVRGSACRQFDPSIGATSPGSPTSRTS